MDTVTPAHGQLYLDLDGVLADFEGAAEFLLGTSNIYKWEFVYGREAFWERLNAVPGGFFANLRPMKGALEFFAEVRHLNPIILTVLPHTGAEAVAAQKRAWVKKWLDLGPDSVIFCQTEDKPLYCYKGDILVDDRAIYRKAWEARGGTFIHCTDGLSWVQYQLQVLGILPGFWR